MIVSRRSYLNTGSSRSIMRAAAAANAAVERQRLQGLGQEMATASLAELMERAQKGYGQATKLALSRSQADILGVVEGEYVPSRQIPTR